MSGLSPLLSKFSLKEVAGLEINLCQLARGYQNAFLGKYNLLTRFLVGLA